VSRAGLVALVLTLGLLAAGCGGGGGGGSPPPIKIAFITNCAGPFLRDREHSQAGAELPFLRRGAKLRGGEPSNGVTAATVARRRVQLLLGCESYGNFTTLLGTLHRFVKNQHADIVVGPEDQGEGLVVKLYAKENPNTTFSLGATGEQSTTLKHPLSNLFRFAADTAQGSAGLGAYAYNVLHWRKAVTVDENDPAGWARVAGFDAEFCALGGRIVKSRWPSFQERSAVMVRRIPRRGVDGVVFTSDLLSAPKFMKSWAKRYPHFGTRLLVNAVGLGDAFSGKDELKGSVRNGMQELVGVSNSPLDPTPESPDGQFRAMSKSEFPGLRGHADYYSYDAMEPVLEALERVHGNLSNGQKLFRKALARVQFPAPNGETSLDKRRQAIAPTYLDRVERRHGKLTVRQIGVVPNVEQTFGGYFGPKASPPGSKPVCKREKPPAWVRSVPTTK
jgi:branched-chain amino acid transport system substrate-binding protein